MKPSGPLKVPLTSVWHYPTFVTRHAEYGMTHDRSNPSLRLHDERFGPLAFMKTQDRITIRYPFVSKMNSGVPWAATYKKWRKIDELHIKLNKALIKPSPIVVFVGEDNCTSWEQLLDFEEGDRTVQVLFKSALGPDGNRIRRPPYVFKKSPAFYIVKDSAGTVKNLVFLVYHSQHIGHTNDAERGAYNDLMWSAAASFAGLDAARHDAYIRYTGTMQPQRKQKPA